jgi:hypothetical protein
MVRKQPGETQEGPYRPQWAPARLRKMEYAWGWKKKKSLKSGLRFCMARILSNLPILLNFISKSGHKNSDLRGSREIKGTCPSPLPGTEQTPLILASFLLLPVTWVDCWSVIHPSLCWSAWPGPRRFFCLGLCFLLYSTGRGTQVATKVPSLLTVEISITQWDERAGQEVPLEDMEKTEHIHWLGRWAERQALHTM